MKLELAIVTQCHSNGCDVTLCKDNQEVRAAYSPLIKNRIHIQPEQLIALDSSIEPPEIVWRWLKGVVIELTDQSIIVDDLQGHPASVTLPAKLPLALHINTDVWVCSTGKRYEIHDLLLEGKPSQSDRLLGYITPIIKEIYQR